MLLTLLQESVVALLLTSEVEISWLLRNTSNRKRGKKEHNTPMFPQYMLFPLALTRFPLAALGLRFLTLQRGLDFKPGQSTPTAGPV